MNLKENIAEIIKNAASLFDISKLKEDNSIYEKGIANFATSVDYEVQNYLIENLSKLLPQANFICEETDDNNYSLDNATWIIDPIDGTTNFMYDYKHSAISVALFMGGLPYMAFIYNPALDEMFFAQKNCGAYLNDIKISVSNISNIKDCLFAFGPTPYDKSKANVTFDIVKDLYLKSKDLRRSGSAALDMAYLASGRIDAFFEMTLKPWDYAAGMLLINEAGGLVTDWGNNTPDCISDTSILCSNENIHPNVLTIIQKYQSC